MLLHGHGANSSTRYHQVAEPGRHHPVYAIDTIDDPGASVQRRPVIGSADAADWLTQALRGLGLDRVHLTGLSYGGWLVLNQAIYRPLATAGPSAFNRALLRRMARAQPGHLAAPRNCWTDSARKAQPSSEINRRRVWNAGFGE
ncbi:alpha/beta fold hydrolase [Streptosporangium sandarakinum]